MAYLCKVGNVKGLAEISPRHGQTMKQWVATKVSRCVKCLLHVCCMSGMLPVDPVAGRICATTCETPDKVRIAVQRQRDNASLHDR